MPWTPWGGHTEHQHLSQLVSDFCLHARVYTLRGFVRCSFVTEAFHVVARCVECTHDATVWQTSSQIFANYGDAPAGRRRARYHSSTHSMSSCLMSLKLLRREIEREGALLGNERGSTCCCGFRWKCVKLALALVSLSLACSGVIPLLLATRCSAERVEQGERESARGRLSINTLVCRIGCDGVDKIR